MKLCYNKSMKIVVKFLVMILFFLPLQAQAITFNVLTLPADLYNMHENYFGFVEPSEIFAEDIITQLNLSGGKVVSPDLYRVRSVLDYDTRLKNSVNAALQKFHYSKYIDYRTFKTVAAKFDAKSVIIIRSYVTSKDNSLKRSIWDVLDITSYFNISHDFYLNTNVILLDVVNDLPMWQNTYVKKISNKEGYFIANNYAQARTQFEKLRKYSHHIVSADAAQNIVLRFFPQVVSPIQSKPVSIEETDGGILRFESNVPSAPPQNKQETDVMNYGEMLMDY